MAETIDVNETGEPEAMGDDVSLVDLLLKRMEVSPQEFIADPDELPDTSDREWIVRERRYVPHGISPKWETTLRYVAAGASEEDWARVDAALQRLVLLKAESMFFDNLKPEKEKLPTWAGSAAAIASAMQRGEVALEAKEPLTTRMRDILTGQKVTVPTVMWEAAYQIYTSTVAARQAYAGQAQAPWSSGSLSASSGLGQISANNQYMSPTVRDRHKEEYAKLRADAAKMKAEVEGMKAAALQQRADQLMSIDRRLADTPPRKSIWDNLLGWF